MMSVLHKMGLSADCMAYAQALVFRDIKSHNSLVTMYRYGTLNETLCEAGLSSEHTGIVKETLRHHYNGYSYLFLFSWQMQKSGVWSDLDISASASIESFYQQLELFPSFRAHLQSGLLSLECLLDGANYVADFLNFPILRQVRTDGRKIEFPLRMQKHNPRQQSKSLAEEGLPWKITPSPSLSFQQPGQRAAVSKQPATDPPTYPLYSVLVYSIAQSSLSSTDCREMREFNNACGHFCRLLGVAISKVCLMDACHHCRFLADYCLLRSQ